MVIRKNFHEKRHTTHMADVIMDDYTLVSGLFTNVQATISNDNFLESLNKKPSSVKISIKSTYPIKMVKTILMWLFKIFNSPYSHFSKNNTSLHVWCVSHLLKLSENIKSFTKFWPELRFGDVTSHCKVSVSSQQQHRTTAGSTKY